MTLWQDIQKHVGVEADGKPGDETARAVARALGIDMSRSYCLGAPKEFFDGVRKVTGHLNDVQVSIINAMLTAASGWTIGWLAYGLATAWHEAKLEPVEEIGEGRGRDYGRVNETGKAPYGRGLVQLTWHKNYERADRELALGGTLASNYARALEPDIAVKILVLGMEEGWFTGKSLADYITGHGTHDQFVKARKIINGVDRAELIAGYAESFKSALIAGGWA